MVEFQMKNRTLLIILGVITVIAGFFAILNPVAGSIAVTLLTGWLFLLIGILQAVATFQETDWSHRLWSLLLAALAILAGIGLLADPLAGVISLTSRYTVHSRMMNMAVCMKLKNRIATAGLAVAGGEKLK